jgi:hypothetical protein
MDFCLSLPIKRLLDGGYSRQPYRNAMAGILPEAIRRRTSKYNVFPDLPVNLAASARGLRARAEKLRGTPAADLFALDAMSEAFQVAASQTAEVRRELAAMGQSRYPSWAAIDVICSRCLAENASPEVRLSPWQARSLVHATYGRS